MPRHDYRCSDGHEYEVFSSANPDREPCRTCVNGGRPISEIRQAERLFSGRAHPRVINGTPKHHTRLAPR